MEEEDVFGGKSDELATIRQKLLDLESQIGALNPRNLAGIKAKELRAATRQNIFGDGSDGNVILNGTTTYTDFSSLAGSTYTLTRDLFAENLTVNTGIILKTNGFRWFCSKDFTNKGTTHANGGNGGNGGNGTAGGSGGNTGGAAGTAGSAAHSSGSLPATNPGIVGGAGGDVNGAGSPNAGSNGSAGADVTKSLGSAGSGGGAGGSGGESGGAGGSGGNGGSKSGTVFNIPRSPQSAYFLVDTQPSSTLAVLMGSCGSGSGAGGGGAGGGSEGLVDPPSGAGGGGSGAPGGMMVGFAYRIINDGTISANGGNGGAGGTGGTASSGNCSGGGGGGGGAGGPGGVIILVYGIKTGSGDITVTGGTAGAAGAKGVAHGSGHFDGNPGTAGVAGGTGTLMEVVVG